MVEQTLENGGECEPHVRSSGVSLMEMAVRGDINGKNPIINKSLICVQECWTGWGRLQRGCRAGQLGCSCCTSCCSSPTCSKSCWLGLPKSKLVVHLEPKTAVAAMGLAPINLLTELANLMGFPEAEQASLMKLVRAKLPGRPSLHSWLI